MSNVRDNLIRDKHNVGEGLLYLAGLVHSTVYDEYAGREVRHHRCVSGLRAYWGNLSKTKRHGEHWRGNQRRKAKRLFGGAMPKGYVCSDCGAQGVKLWRPSYDTDPLRCAACATKCETEKGHITPRGAGCNIGFLIPAVPDEDGNTWGYSSVPEHFCIWWYRLPLVQA